MVGGPAYNSRQLHRGDVIVKVNGNAITQANIHDIMVGDDMPGAPVVVNVRMTRMATEEIYDRRRMFELFTSLKVCAFGKSLSLSCGGD